VTLVSSEEYEVIINNINIPSGINIAMEHPLYMEVLMGKSSINDIYIYMIMIMTTYY